MHRLFITALACLISVSLFAQEETMGCMWYMADNYNPDATDNSTCLISISEELSSLLLWSAGEDANLPIDDGILQIEDGALFPIHMGEGFGAEIINQLAVLAPFISSIIIYDGGMNDFPNDPITSLNLSNDYTNLEFIEIRDTHIHEIIIGDIPSLTSVYIESSNMELYTVDISNYILSPNMYSFLVGHNCSGNNLMCLIVPESYGWLSVFGCEDNIVYSNEICTWPNIGENMEGECQNILDWSHDWIFTSDDIANYDAQSPGENQTTPSPFQYNMGFNVETNECLTEATVSFNPLENWSEISIEIIGENGDIIQILNPGDEIVIDINEPIEDEFFYEGGGFYDLGCPACSSFVSVYAPWININMNVVITPSCNSPENDLLNSPFNPCLFEPEYCNYFFDGEVLSVGAIYMNSWSDSNDNEEEGEQEEPQPPVGCYYAHINSDGLNEVVWENTDVEEYQNSEIKVFRQSINYSSSSSYGWEEIGTATMTDELFIDSNEFYTQFETRYKFDVITETTTSSECEGESVNVNEWQSYMIRTSVLSISNSPTQDVNIYWNSASNTDYYKLKRRQNSEDDFEDYIDLPHYITSFTDRSPHTGYSEYIIVRTLSNGQYCTPNGNFELTSNIVTNDNSFICSPGCTYMTATNYNEEATTDNGSCEFEETVSNDCVADLDGNGQVGSPDLLLFLSAFGDECE